jgi:hypothetical protein
MAFATYWRVLSAGNLVPRSVKLLYSVLQSFGTIIKEVFGEIIWGGKYNNVVFSLATVPS